MHYAAWVFNCEFPSPGVYEVFCWVQFAAYSGDECSQVYYRLLRLQGCRGAVTVLTNLFVISIGP